MSRTTNEPNGRVRSCDLMFELSFLILIELYLSLGTYGQIWLDYFTNEQNELNRALLEPKSVIY